MQHLPFWVSTLGNQASASLCCLAGLCGTGWYFCGVKTQYQKLKSDSIYNREVLFRRVETVKLNYQGNHIATTSPVTLEYLQSCMDDDDCLVSWLALNSAFVLHIETNKDYRASQTALGGKLECLGLRKNM